MKREEFLHVFSFWQRESVRSLLENVGTILYGKQSIQYKTGSAVISVKSPFKKVPIIIAVHLMRPTIAFPWYNPDYVFIHNSVKIRFVDLYHLRQNQSSYTTARLTTYGVEQFYGNIEKTIIENEKQRAIKFEQDQKLITV